MAGLLQGRAIPTFFLLVSKDGKTLVTKTLLISAIFWLFVLSAVLPAAGSQSITSKEVIVLFAVFEGARINVYSSHLDGSNRKLLLSEETKLTNARPFDVISARVSPDSGLIAYKLGYGRAPLRLMDANGENKKKIVDEVEAFYWSLGSSDILYSAPLPPPDPMEELSFHADGYEWHKLNLQTGKDEIVAVRTQKLHRFGGWISSERALFISYRLGNPLLYVLNVKAGSTTPVELPPGLMNPEVSVSPTGRRIVVSAEGTHACVFYEVGVKGKTVNQIAARDNRCEEIAWNGDDEFFYGAWLNLPHGQTNEWGHYALISVNKYDFRVRRSSAVLLSKGKQVYRLQGILPAKAMIVSNESNSPSPQYILERRNLGGNHPVTLFSSAKEMLFVGYLR